MTVLQLGNCPLDPRLGSGQTRLAWADGLRALGHKVTAWDSDALLGDARSEPRGRRWRLGWRAWRRLAQGDLSRCDVIEFFGAEFWLPTLLLSLRSRRRRPLLVAHSDGSELLMAETLARLLGPPLPSRWPLERVVLGQAFARADGFVTGSAPDLAYAQARGFQPPGRAVMIPPGLDERFLTPMPSAEGRGNVLAFTGSWIPAKGAGAFAAASSRLLRERPSLRVLLLGTGGREEKVRADFPPEGQDRLEVRPSLDREELREELDRAGVFALPTVYEGFGLALAEALARGSAAVTTPTGLGGSLADGEEVLHVPFGEVDALHAALSRLLDDPALRARLAAAGRRRAEALRWDRSVHQLAETYETWLAA